MKTVFLVIFLFLANAASAYTGYRGYRAQSEPLPTSEGELIYQESGCVMCHGIQGDGDGFLAEGLDPKPTDFTNYEKMENISDSQLESVIRNGIPGGGHPSFSKFTDNQMQELIIYLRSLSAETYLTVNICFTDNVYVIDTKKEEPDFRVEVANPDLIQANKKGNLVYIIPNKFEFLKGMMNKKVTRTYIKLIEKAKPSSIIAVRLHRCSR